MSAGSPTPLPQANRTEVIQPQPFRRPSMGRRATPSRTASLHHKHGETTGEPKTNLTASRPS
jgi:hypothetical protein